jgi:hypothetical protein
MLIDCEKCEVRNLDCGHCVVGVLLGGAEIPLELGADERRALRVLADGGLVPQLLHTTRHERAS